MKITKTSFLLLVLSIGISCDKDNDPEITLAQNLQNGFWENDDSVLKFDGTNIAFSGICTSDYCSPNFPCVSETFIAPYTLGDNTITLTDQDETYPIKIEGDILTVDNDIIHQRRETLDYSDCE